MARYHGTNREFGFEIFFQQKDYFPLISVKVALRYVSDLLKSDENDEGRADP